MDSKNFILDLNISFPSVGLLKFIDKYENENRIGNILWDILYM